MNLFTAIAEHRSKQGEDMEQVAKELAWALKRVIVEGCGQEQDLNEEFQRLLTIPEDTQ